MVNEHHDKIRDEIAALERQHLDSITAPIVDLPGILDGLEFVRINGITQTIDPNNIAQKTPLDLVIGAHTFPNEYLIFTIISDKSKVRIYCGGKNASTIETLIKGSIPGAKTSNQTLTDLGHRVRSFTSHMGILSGVPLYKNETLITENVTQSSYLDQIIRSLNRCEWIWIVRAYPVAAEAIYKERTGLFEKANFYTTIIRQQLQRTVQSSSSPVINQTDSVGGELINREAQYLVNLLDQEIERLDRSTSLGRWQVACYYASPDKLVFEKLGALLSGSLSGTQGHPDRIRIHECNTSTNAPEEYFHTLLTSEELASLIQTPTTEVPGFSISEEPSFDVDFRPSPNNDLPIGNILWNHEETSQIYKIKSQDITRHGAIFGVTGSGKTTTLLNILDHLSGLSPVIPFLVIEPAKTEYRALLGDFKSNQPNGPIPNLRIYTLGNDVIAPFRLNPFEFDTGDEAEAEAVLTHIDYLKAVFNTAFILYAPMPYVLDMALHEVYEDKGWDLVSGMNTRLSLDDWKNRSRFPIFPTLSDLYQKVDQVTKRLGYDERIERDVIAGLRARIGSMRLGSKGLMLDTPRGIPMDRLLAKPTILELENIGSDDEKTFVMGLLLARIFAYRRRMSRTNQVSVDLQHLLVIEEAHRLLKNVNTVVDVESSNLRAQAVEVFSNMLSEVRHYGQGVFVAEQIPSKLTPDILKNTNFKVVHRLLSRDDREAVAATINLSDEQSRFFSILQRGDAIVFSEGDDRPYQIRIPDIRSKHKLRSPNDSSLTAHAGSHINLEPFMSITDWKEYGIPVRAFLAPDRAVYQASMSLILQPDVIVLFTKLIISCLYATNGIDKAIEKLFVRSLSTLRISLTEEQKQFLHNMLLVAGLDHELQSRGIERGWSYGLIDQLRHQISLYVCEQTSTAESHELEKFQSLYRHSGELSYGQYPGCKHCKAKCLYHLETNRLVSSFDVSTVAAIINKPTRKIEEKNQRIREALLKIVQNWLGERNTSEEKDIAYCSGLIIASRMGLDEYSHEEYADNLANILGL